MILKKNFYIIVALIVLFVMTINNMYSYDSYFGKFKVVGKSMTEEKYQLLVQMEDKDEIIKITDDTTVINKEKKSPFTHVEWNKINVKDEYQMDIHQNRFPVSLYKGKYSLNLFYLD